MFARIAGSHLSVFHISYRSSIQKLKSFKDTRILDNVESVFSTSLAFPINHKNQLTYNYCTNSQSTETETPEDNSKNNENFQNVSPSYIETVPTKQMSVQPWKNVAVKEWLDAKKRLLNQDYNMPIQAWFPSADHRFNMHDIEFLLRHLLMEYMNITHHQGISQETVANWITKIFRPGLKRFIMGRVAHNPRSGSELSSVRWSKMFVSPIETVLAQSRYLVAMELLAFSSAEGTIVPPEIVHQILLGIKNSLPSALPAEKQHIKNLLHAMIVHSTFRDPLHLEVLQLVDPDYNQKLHYLFPPKSDPLAGLSNEEILQRVDELTSISWPVAYELKVDLTPDDISDERLLEDQPALKASLSRLSDASMARSMKSNLNTLKTGRFGEDDRANADQVL